MGESLVGLSHLEGIFLLLDGGTGILKSIKEFTGESFGHGFTFAAAENYEAGMLKAETTEMDKFLAVMRQRLEETQEELEKIMEQIQNIYSDIAAIINSAIDTESEIAKQMGQMA